MKPEAPPAAPTAPAVPLDTEFKRGLGLFSGTMIVAGSMIGSGIFIVSADMARLIASPGWLLVAWAITGALTMAGALSYGELAALMPRAGGQYVFLRESLSPIWGFLYGWTFLLVIQAGTIAAVAVAFARFGGLSESDYLINPIKVLPGYAVSLSKAQLVAIGMIVLLTITNMRGIDYGKWIQNLFTVAKTGALLIMILLGLTLGWNSEAVSSNFGNFWAVRNPQPIVDGLTALTAFGLFAALCVAQTGSLFSADAWHNIATGAGEVREPRRKIPLALAFGAGGVILLYMLANVAYLVSLPLDAIQNAPSDRVATAMMNRIFPGIGVIAMSAAIMVSTFGCNNGLILSGARVYYAMARDNLFFKRTGELHPTYRTPAFALIAQAIWTCVLCLSGTYSELLNYVIFAAVLFYMLTGVGLFALRTRRPDANRPVMAVGYPWLPGIYVVLTGLICINLLMQPAQQRYAGLGLIVVVLGVPVYYGWRRFVARVA